jgi:hypothetical protein
MIIKSKKVNKCQTCGKMCGYIMEKNNGKVIVLCNCIQRGDIKLSLSSTDGKKFSWNKGSTYKNDDGKTLYKQNCW